MSTNMETAKTLDGGPILNSLEALMGLRTETEKASERGDRTPMRESAPPVDIGEIKSRSQNVPAHRADAFKAKRPGPSEPGAAPRPAADSTKPVKPFVQRTGRRGRPRVIDNDRRATQIFLSTVERSILDETGLRATGLPNMSEGLRTVLRNWDRAQRIVDALPEAERKRLEETEEALELALAIARIVLNAREEFYEAEEDEKAEDKAEPSAEATAPEEANAEAPSEEGKSETAEEPVEASSDEPNPSEPA